MAFPKGGHHSEETKKKLSEAFKGRVSPNKGIKWTDAQRARISSMRRGKKLSQAHKDAISQGHRTSEKSATQRAKIFKFRPSGLEIFIKECFEKHGGYEVIHQGHIPGFSKMANRWHPFDFLLRAKKRAIEVDGTYFHSDKNKWWDPVRDDGNVIFAALLGWKVVRIKEEILRRSPAFIRWCASSSSAPRYWARTIAQTNRTHSGDMGVVQKVENVQR